MLHIGIDQYVIDTLMPDLVGHDHSPSAFLVYLFLWSQLYRAEQRRLAVSLQQIAEGTGLSKSAVQAGMRVLQRRHLIAISRRSRTAVPEYELLRHWMRRRAKAQNRS
jgi:hypothetical protein